MSEDRKMGFMWGVIAGSSLTFAAITGFYIMAIFAPITIYACYSFGAKRA